MPSNVMTSWEHGDTVYTSSKTSIQMRGHSTPLIILGRFFPFHESPEAFCKICQSQKVYGDLLITTRSSEATSSSMISILLPLEFCAGTFIKVQENISNGIQDLLLGSAKALKSMAHMGPVLLELLSDNPNDLNQEITLAFLQDIPSQGERRSLFCKDSCELPQNLFQALSRSVTEHGSKGYYAQKGLSELFALINQHWPTFGVFWPSEVGAIGTATVNKNEIIINLQLMSIRYHYRP